MIDRDAQIAELRRRIAQLEALIATIMAELQLRGYFQ